MVQDQGTDHTNVGESKGTEVTIQTGIESAKSVPSRPESNEVAEQTGAGNSCSDNGMRRIPVVRYAAGPGWEKGGSLFVLLNP